MQQRNFGMARVYLELGADPNFGHPSPLELLCKRDDLTTGADAKMLEALLKAGADPFASFDGKTAMDSLTSSLGETDAQLYAHHKERFDEAMGGNLASEAQFETDDMNEPNTDKAALLWMQALLVRAMHDRYQRLRKTKAGSKK